MKKIDNWLSIQRYVTEASRIVAVTDTSNVELWGKVQRSMHAERSVRSNRFLLPRITRI